MVAVLVILTDSPVTTPAELTTAIEVAMLLHVPPPASDKEIVKPEHTLIGVPRIAVGKGLTVTVVDVKQPEPTV